MQYHVVHLEKCNWMGALFWKKHRVLACTQTFYCNGVFYFYFSNFSNWWSQRWDYKYGNCYTFNGGIDKNNEPIRVLGTSKPGPSQGMQTGGLASRTIDNGKGKGNWIGNLKRYETECFHNLLWYTYKRLMHLTGGPTWLRSAIAEIKQQCNIT